MVLTHTLPFEASPAWLMDLFKDEARLFFLDSSLQDNVQGRFSYLGFSPFQTIEAKNFNELKKAIKPYMGLKNVFPMSCAAVGAMAYEGNLRFGLYDGILCVDHYKQTLTISAYGWPYKDKIKSKKAAEQRIRYVLYKLENHPPMRSPAQRRAKDFKIISNTTPGQYIGAVKKALKHIYDGDIYQINLAHCFEAKIKDWQTYVHPVEIYKHLRELSPSPFCAYLDDGKQIILSSSPERFLKLNKGAVQVRPMKGTRPRGENSKQDHQHKEELLHSPKEKAELLMVTDLERNDLGRVCEYGSVHVKDMRTIEEYSTVFQATSTVEGVLRKDKDQFDLLESTFPSGSVTGCPKIEAMKVISQLEKSPRGFYTGALGYINFSGDMDFNVLIRTLFLEKDKISFYVGGGIVADSDPKKEYEETLVKAKAMVQALKLSFR